jgi:hypothetical protein
MIFLSPLNNCRKLSEIDTQNNTMREELRKLRTENEQLKVQGFQKDGERSLLHSPVIF